MTPPFAARLSRRLLPFQDTDAVLGDIAEESRHRSRAWYWAQIVAMILVGSFRDIRRHPLLALRAIAVGVASLTALFSVLVLLSNLETGIWFGNFQIQWAARSNPLNLYFRMLPFWLSVRILFYALCAASGWFAGRLHRAHGIAMVMSYAMFFVAAVIVGTVISAVKTPTTSLLSGLILVGTFVQQLSQAGAVLLGGYLATKSQELA